MAAIGWSVDGVRVEVRAGLPAGKLAVGDEIIKLKSKGEWPVIVKGRTLTFRRKAKFMGLTQELLDGEAVVPPSKEHYEPTAAPSGMFCAGHEDRPAQVACLRCGAFACESCARPDGAHCPACFERRALEEKEKAAAMAYLVPIPLFFLLAGLVGVAIGGLAGGLVYFLIRRTKSKSAKLGIAIALYGLAAVITLVLAALLVFASET